MSTAANSNVTAIAPALSPVSLAPFDPRAFYPKDWVEAFKYAEILARAPSLLPEHIRTAKDPIAETFAHMMFGFEVGLAPLQALSAIYIVKGKKGMYAIDQLALIQKHPDCERLEVDVDSRGAPLSSDTSCTWVTKRRGQKEQRLTFTMQEAVAAGLAQNRKYGEDPKRMLMWRCLTRLLSYTWPGVLRGMEDREQLEDREKDGGWAERTSAPPEPKAPRPVEVTVSEPLPPHDPVTGVVVEPAAAVPDVAEGQSVDPQSASYLKEAIEAATSLGQLQARASDVAKAKAAGKVSAEESATLEGSYKAKRAELSK